MSNYYLSSLCPCGGKIQAVDSPEHRYKYVCEACSHAWINYDDAIQANDKAIIMTLDAHIRKLRGL